MADALPKRAVAWRVLAAVLYAVVTSVVGWLVTRLLRDEPLVGGGHAATIRACVVRPTGETLADVGGLDATKDALRRSRGLLEKRHALAHLIPRGAGLTGESLTQRGT